MFHRDGEELSATVATATRPRDIGTCKNRVAQTRHGGVNLAEPPLKNSLIGPASSRLKWFGPVVPKTCRGGPPDQECKRQSLTPPNTVLQQAVRVRSNEPLRTLTLEHVENRTMAKRKPAEPAPASGGSFEESLQSIVLELENGAPGLEASLARFERGVGLLRVCHGILESAEQKIETLTQSNTPDLSNSEFLKDPTRLNGSENVTENRGHIDTNDKDDSPPKSASLF